MARRWVAAALAVLVAPSLCGAITLDEYLDRVRETHPFFERESLQTDIERQRREGLLGAEDWVLEASPSFTHLEPLQVSPFDPERVDILSVGAGLSRSFWGSGSRVSLRWLTDVTDQNLPAFSIPGPAGDIEIPIGPSTYYSHAVSVTYSLPLLRNRGGELDRLQYELARYDVDVSRAVALENQEGLLFEIGLKFLDWVLLEEERKIAVDRLDLANEELDRTRRKRTANLVDEVDVRRAEDAVHVAEGALLAIESGIKATRAELATLAAAPEMMTAHPDFDLYQLPAIEVTEGVIPRITAGSRLVKTLRAQREQLVRTEAGFVEATKPDLSLNLSGTLRGGNDDIGGSLEMTQPDVTVGLEFRYPLGNRSADAQVETTQLRIRQVDKAIDDVELSLTASLRNVTTQIAELRAVIDNNLLQIGTAGRRTQEEIDLYTQGRGDLTFVIQSRDREATSKLSYAENAARYHRLVLQYRNLADEILTDAGR